MPDIYPYADENRLQHPHAYMYPPLHGIPFFSAYAENRLNAAKRCLSFCQTFALPSGIASVLCEAASGTPIGTLLLPEECRQSLLKKLKIVHGPQLSVELASKSIEFEHSINTVTVISELLQSFPLPNKSTRTAGDFLQARFEGKRLLFATYEIATKKGEKLLENIRPYADFALYLGACWWQTQNLRQLNALLKLGDLLCSVVSEMTEEEAWLTACTLMLETCCTQRLLDQMRGRHADH